MTEPHGNHILPTAPKVTSHTIPNFEVNLVCTAVLGEVPGMLGVISECPERDETRRYAFFVESLLPLLRLVPPQAPRIRAPLLC